MAAGATASQNPAYRPTHHRTIIYQGLYARNSVEPHTSPTFAALVQSQRPDQSSLPSGAGGGGNVYNINLTAPHGANADEFGRLVRDTVRSTC